MEERISPSTLKRIWGYVGMKVTPRPFTLDALSRYVGYRDWRAFRADLRRSAFSSSGYFDAERIDAGSLQEGDEIRIGWRPDRVVTLLYLGAQRFRVLSSDHAKLQVGDEFVAGSIVKGFPLVLPTIERGGDRTPSYIAGREGGIVFIRKV